MAEQTLDIVQKGQYKNLYLKPKLKEGIPGIDPGNFVIVKKAFVDGRPNPSKLGYGISYSCGVEYNGEKCSFWLNEPEHEVYKNLGGVGDSIKITLTEEARVNKKTGAKNLIPVLAFELVQ